MENRRFVTRKITRNRDGRPETLPDQLAVEAPVTIYLNGDELVTLLCTPELLDRLALGFLRSEGLLTSIDEVTSLRVRREEGLVEVDLRDGGGLAQKLYGKRTLTSGCGKGTVFFSALDSLRSTPLPGTLRLDAAAIPILVRELQERAGLFKATGGVHGTALAEGSKILFFCEDIGRHNALDKVVGECLLAGIDTADKIIVSSGRLSSEILLKAAKLQIQILLSRSAPTSLCVDLAEKLNVTLVGFVRGRRFNLYTHGWRILSGEQDPG